MISLKKFLDQNSDPPPPLAEKVASRVEPETFLHAWRSLLFAVGDSVERAIPALGPALQQKLSALGRTVGASPTKDAVETINLAACAELAEWSGEAARYYGEHERELKEIMAVVTRMAETIGHRDDRYVEEIGGFAARLRTVAEESSMTVIRKSIIESAGAVQTCVTRMAKEGRETVRQLTAQTEEYRKRLLEAERISLLDPLTGIGNRRGLEADMERRMKEHKPFSVILLDLDEFKTINDLNGHQAGDDLLRQFAAELRAQFTSTDLVARIGGDEFLGVVAGYANEAELRAEKIRSWVLGNYKISDGNRKIEVHLSASLGLTAWDGKEAAECLLARADARMYEAKAAARASATLAIS